MPTISQGLDLLEATEIMIKAARKAYPSADDEMIKVACNNSVAIVLGTEETSPTVDEKGTD